MTFSRTVRFKSDNLGRDVRIILCFSPPSLAGGNAVAWKVATFAAEGKTSLTATYENNLAFFVPQVKDEGLITTDLYTYIEPGKETLLSVTPGTNPPLYEFSAPITVGGTQIAVNNLTGGAVDIGFGFLTNFGHPNETLNKVQVWDKVGTQNTVKVEFQPILSLYADFDTDYQKDTLVGKLPQPNWSQDLRPLMSFSTWNISVADDGRVVVTNADD